MKKILIADDDEDIRRILIDQLERAGYQVLSTGDGLEALEMVGREKPDAVVLDIMMPGTHGFAVCHKIKTDESLKHIKVLILSAKGFASDQRQAKEVGADLFISKPMDNQDFLRAVRGLLGE